MLTQILEYVSLVQDKQDSLIWIYCPNKKFAINYFSLQVQECFADADQNNLGATFA